MSLINTAAALQLSSYCVQIQDYLLNLQVAQQFFTCLSQSTVSTVGRICHDCILNSFQTTSQHQNQDTAYSHNILIYNVKCIVHSW
jgi:hypothetical protein